MAIPAENFLPFDSRDLFGGIVEEENPPIHVMGQDAVLEIVEDVFQISPVCYAVEDHDNGHIYYQKVFVKEIGRLATET